MQHVKTKIATQMTNQSEKAPNEGKPYCCDLDRMSAISHTGQNTRHVIFRFSLHLSVHFLVKYLFKCRYILQTFTVTFKNPVFRELFPFYDSQSFWNWKIPTQLLYKVTYATEWVTWILLVTLDHETAYLWSCDVPYMVMLSWHGQRIYILLDYWPSYLPLTSRTCADSISDRNVVNKNTMFNLWMK